MLSFLHKHLDKNGYELWNLAFQEKQFTKKEYVLSKKEKINVFLTMTTCKRFDLFEKTVQSILHTWKDIDQVDAWFCVDDNSSEEDREKMKQYSWIDYYRKGPSEKGHRTSMNLIWNKLQEVKPTYWIHIEDDFEFHVERSYVMDAIRGLEIMGVEQVIYNRNYGETIHDYDIKGHIPVTDDFCVHDHKLGNFSYKNCHYWPHYSFRPGMTKVSAILKLGNFDSPNTFFEMDYARRWTNSGYKTGFFNQITCQHIGKLTKDKSTPNAYQLNQCDQFSSFVKVVNLERRPDRKARMQEELKGISHEFVKAVDWKELRPTEEMRRLFEKNDYGNRKSFMGCALSHYQLWKQLLQDTKEYYFIMEDDATVCKDFARKLSALDPVMKEKEICFLGYHMFSKDRDERYQHDKDPIIQPLQSIFVGGTFAYSINKEGARKMIEYIEINGIQHGIDYVMKIAPVECVECIPHLVFSEWCEDGKIIDTDIQKNYESMEWDYVFMKGLDYSGNDFKRVSFDIKECKNPCIAINTLGYIKHRVNVHQLKPSIYFGEKDGIYIKKEYYDLQKLIRVKMLCNWCSSEQLCKEWSNMCETNFTWQHIQMVWEGECDYYVVINSTDEYHDPEKTIVFQMEPWVYDMTKPWGVKTWGTWAKPTGYLHVHDRDTYVNNVNWLLEQTYSQWLDMKIEKTKGLSTICSAKYFDEGHILRIDLLKQLDQQIEIDIYNQDNHHQFKQWKGSLSHVNKSKGMLPYRYYFMMENNFEKNYITEKLWEPILCESLCFYYGCPNVEDHVDPRAYVLLDKDIDTSIALIQQAIKEDWYTQRLPYIRNAKMDLLYRMSFFPTLNTIIQSKKRSNPFTEQYKRVCFIHSCHIKEVGTSILEHMVEMVLRQEFDKIFVVNIGEPVNIVHPKIQVIEYSKNIYSFELETINLIRTFSENQECDVLYLHTKGITQRYQNVTDWVNMMLYFLVEKTEECVEKLKEYDTVGCNLYLHSHECRSHYSGNFWWAKTSYLRTLPYLSMISRHEAELWMLMNHKCKCYSMHNSRIDHYRSSYPKNIYTQCINLKEMVDNSRTDKNTVHSYLDLYQKLLINKKETAKNVLEVGISNGGSIKLWNDFFTNATVYGLDIINDVWEGIKNNEKIILHTSTDAYNDDFFVTHFLNKNIRCDFMLDDGPHTLESMKQFIKLYSQIMTDDGILIIEDVQSWDWIDILKNEVPEHLKPFIKYYDLRSNKNRYDDIVFTNDKSNLSFSS